jgi:hypothetical protein
MVTLDAASLYCGLRVIRIENDSLAVEILPDLGAKILRLIHKPSGQNLLWENPRLRPETAPFGSSFDNHWSGGWDEVLPNDLPAAAPGGDMLPEHGEFWTQPAEVRVLAATTSVCEVSFTQLGRVLPTSFEKTVIVTASDPFVRVRYAFSHAGDYAFPFLWNIHPAMSISPATWLDVPARTGVTDPWRETHFVGNTTFRWPYATDRAGNPVDLRRVEPPEAGTADMHYLTDVEDGWYAVTDRAAQVGFALRFPVELFRHVWLFRTFGGWRGLYTLILEASAGYPYALADAVANGTCGIMPPHGSLEAEVLAIPYAGARSVVAVEPDGRVLPRA